MTSVQVEEDIMYVEFEVRRVGSLGDVSVTVVTTQDTAVSPEGQHIRDCNGQTCLHCLSLPTDFFKLQL